jgi:hypothetical protein
MTNPLHVPQHKLPQTLEEALKQDQERHEQWYKEFLANKERYQKEENGQR